MNIYHLTLQKTRDKYFKFKKRLEKSISSGEFQTLPRKKKNRLVSRVEKFRRRLESNSAFRRGAMIAGSMALIPSLALAQVTPDPLMRFEGVDRFLSPFGTNQQVEIVNIDSDADMEVVMSTTSRGFIFHNQGNYFSDSYQSSLADMEEEFFLGDVDGDSDVDIVFKNGSYFYLAFNDGDGNFTLTNQEYAYSSFLTPGAIARETSPQDVDLVDFDGDGDLDLVMAYGADDLIHFDNDGDGYFSTAEYLYVANGGMTDFEFADLDGDGDMDVIYNQDAGGPSSSVRVKENTADGPSIPIFSGANVELLYNSYNSFEQITVFDMDGDEDLDIFTADNASTIGYTHSLFENQYDQGNDFSFNSVATSGIAAEAINDVAVGDLDGDGNDDLFISSLNDTKAATFDGTELSATDRSLKSGIGDATSDFSSLALGDIDGDGLIDMVGVYSSNDPNIYYDRSAPEISDFDGDVIIDENSPSGAFATLILADFHNDPITAILGGADAGLFSFNSTSGELSANQSFDWENFGSVVDLNLELSDGNKSRTEDLNIRINNLKELGQGYLDPQAITLFATDERSSNFLAGDLDQDGDDDLVVGDNNDPVRIYFNNGVGLINSTYNDYFYFKDADFIDFDDDGDLDLFLLRDYAVSMLRNQGSYFTKYNPGAGISNDSFGMIAGDFDNDGLEDAGVISSTGDYFYFRKFELSADLSSLNQEQQLSFKTSGASGILESYGKIVDFEITDFDGDNNDDLLVIIEDEGANPGTDVLFIGDGSSFSSTPSAVTGFQTDNGYNRVEVEDFNGDGAIDLATFRSNGSNLDIDIMLNDGSGSFSVNQTLTTSGVNDGSGDELTDMVFADMDGDGTIDIISTNKDGAEGYELRMFLNDGSGNFSLAQTISGFDGLDIELVDIDNDDDSDVMVRELKADRDVFKVYFNANVAATDISLSTTSFDEHLPSDTEIATISVTDINPQDTHILYLAEGDGSNDAHNNFFAINGNSLVITRDVSAENFPTLNILLAADDGENVYQQPLVLTVNDVNQAPTAISLETASFDESVLPGSAVSNIIVEDPNVEDSHTLSLVEGDGSDDNNSFTIQGNQLVLIKSIEFNSTPSLSVRIAANDGRDSFEQALTLTVNEVLGLDDELKNVLGIYPNPGRNEIHFNIENDLLGKMYVNVSDLSGRIIYQFESEKTSKVWSHSLDMRDQETGVYIIEVTIDKMKVTQRWIKQD